MKVIKLTERDLRNIVKRVISESEGAEETTESKPRCLTTNTMSLDEINGDSDSFRPYSDSINKRNFPIKRKDYEYVGESYNGYDERSEHWGVFTFDEYKHLD